MSNANQAGLPGLLRFWLSPADLTVRFEARYPEGVEQHVCKLSIDRDGPNVSGECPDEFAAELAGLAADALDGNSTDPRFIGLDASLDAALDACDAEWLARHPEAA